MKKYCEKLPHLRRVLALLLALCLFCGMMPLQTLATEPDQMTPTTVNETQAADTTPVENSDPTADTCPPPTDTQPPTEPQPTGDTMPTGDTEPTGDTQPTDGTEPTGGTQPTDGTEPTGGTQPTDGTEPTGGTQPTDGTEPTDDTQPSEDATLPGEADTEPTTEPEHFTVTLHDVHPQGGENRTSAQVQPGQSLVSLMEGKTWADGFLLTKCIWYTLDEAGEKTPVDLTQEVHSDLELYTYSYQVGLTLSQEDAAGSHMIMPLNITIDEDPASGQLTLNITGREGTTLSPAELVMGGVDYNLYVWKMSDGTTWDITQPITGPLVLTSDGMVTNITEDSGEIAFYVSIEDRWVEIARETMTVYAYQGRRYLSAAQMEAIYADYGYSAADAKPDERLLAHCELNTSYIWGNRLSIKVDDNIYYPILDGAGKGCKVYYIPNSEPSYAGWADDNAKANSFYRVRISDPGGKVYAPGEIPTVEGLFLRGKDAEIPLCQVPGVEWACRHSDGTVQECVTSDAGVVTIKNVGGNCILSPKAAPDEIYLTYNTNIVPNRRPVFEDYELPTVAGEEIYESLISNSVAVYAPSNQTYFYDVGTAGFLGKATFQGWKLVADGVDTGKIIQPGDDLRTKLAEFGVAAQDVYLVAQWQYEHSNGDATGGDDTGNIGKHSSMVNFFVALSAQSEGEDYINNYGTWTSSVYTTDCGVKTTENAENVGGLTGSHAIVRGGDCNGSGLTIDEATEQVRELRDGYVQEVEYNGEIIQNHFQIDFPSDEEVLYRIRRMVAAGTVITLNGKKIEEKDLYDNKFTIKWFVFKYANSNGWHVDGVLAAKEGQMVVTKIFAGDQANIDAVTPNYSITVDAEQNAIHGDTELTVENASLVRGNTYTWYVPVDQYFSYTLRENNYLPQDEGTSLSAQYMVKGSEVPAQNTGGWKTYQNDGGAGQTVTVQGRNFVTGGNNLAVSFLNTYTAPGTVLIHKVDGVTGNPMANVAFTIEKQGDNSFGIYFGKEDHGAGSYTTKASEGHGKASQIVTNEAGQIYLEKMPVGTYILKEIVPDGYDSPGDITVTLAGTEENQYEAALITSASAANGGAFVETDPADPLRLTIKNYARLIDVEIVKNWQDNLKKPVTIQLWRNGKSLSTDYRITLDGSEGWKTTIKGLPLYADGVRAQYSIREMKIGDFSYTEDFEGGYKYYDVSYHTPEDLDANGEITVISEAIQTIRLGVSNKRHEGEPSLRKVDQDNQPLGGAEFWLYNVPGDTPPEPWNVNAYPPVMTAADGTYYLDLGEPLRKIVSRASDGNVYFAGLPTGYYYVVEHKAPARYEGTRNLFLLYYDGVSTQLQMRNEKIGGGFMEELENPVVMNFSKDIPFYITKTVTGSMGDQNRSFHFTVTCSDPMLPGDGYTLSEDGRIATFSLSHGGTMLLNGVMKGAVVTVTENDALSDGYEIAFNGGALGTTNSYSVDIPATAKDAITLPVVNNKDGTPDTGVTLDTMPYWLVLSVAAGAAVLALKRRRREW